MQSRFIRLSDSQFNKEYFNLNLQYLRQIFSEQTALPYFVVLIL